MTAWISGFLGLALTALIGIFRLDMTAVEALNCAIASMSAGMLALLVATRGGAHPWVRKRLMPGPFSTWLIFLAVYFGFMWLAAPPLRTWHRFFWLIFPLIMSTGFTIVAFGPIQDRYVNRIMAKAKSKG